MSPSRYVRQEIFEPVGPEGQRRIAAGSAAVVGCGALGAHAANALARAGVGRLRIIDRDVVELDNLQRQVLFDEEDARRRAPKAQAAAERLREVNSEIALDPQVAALTAANAQSLLAGAGVVVDGTDNVETRLLVNDWCLRAGVPYVYGGAVGATGMTFTIVGGRTPCFRCLLGTLPEPGTVPTAATAGILGATTAVLGALEAMQALQVLMGVLEPGDEVLCVDVWDREFTRLKVPRAADCPACVQGRYEFLERAGRQ